MRWSMLATAWKRPSTRYAVGPANSPCSGCRCSCSRRATIARPQLAFAEIARLTKGAHCRFDAGSAEQLKSLLTAVAVYAAGGRKALERLSTQTRNGGGARKLLGQMR